MTNMAPEALSFLNLRPVIVYNSRLFFHQLYRLRRAQGHKLCPFQPA